MYKFKQELALLRPYIVSLAIFILRENSFQVPCDYPALLNKLPDVGSFHGTFQHLEKEGLQTAIRR